MHTTQHIMYVVAVDLRNLIVAIPECSVVELRCNDSLCIHEDKWCDGVGDCLDRSDEPPLCYLGTILPFNSYAFARPK